MTEQEAKEILENYREVDDSTGEEYNHKIIRCLGRNNDSYIFECESNGYLDLKTGIFMESANTTYEVAVFSDGAVICLPL